jgi:hypothetical protein
MGARASTPVSSFVVLLSLTLLAGCATHYGHGVMATDPYGFFSGIWHGFIFPLTLLVNMVSWLLSLLGISFLESVQIIGRPNTGFFFYYIGFILGLSWAGVL